MNKPPPANLTTRHCQSLKMKYFFGSPTFGFVCGDAEALTFDHFVVGFYSFLLCELSSKNPSNTFLNLVKIFFFFLFFGLLTLNFVFDSAQALVFEVFFFFFGLWWEIEEGDEILGTLFYIGLKT